MKAKGKTAVKVTAKKAGNAKVTGKFTLKGVKKVQKVTLKVRVKKASKANNATETPGTASRQPAATAAVSPSASPATTTPSTNPATTTPTKNPDGFEPVLFKNATFENGTDDFVSRGSSKVSQADNGYEGKCLYVSGRTDTWNGAAIDVTSTIVPGAKYHVTAYMNHPANG